MTIYHYKKSVYPYTVLLLKKKAVFLGKLLKYTLFIRFNVPVITVKSILIPLETQFYSQMCRTMKDGDFLTRLKRMTLC